jgi:protein tyrosine phosphatase (PTP) superfamily phosphohydrolase (DUF442 family)
VNIHKSLLFFILTALSANTYVMSMDKTTGSSTAEFVNLIQTHAQETHLTLFESFLKLFWYRFYEVTPNKFYRSAQMPPDVLKKYIQVYGIKTIVNLRGKNETATWWLQEKAAVEECGVAFFNIAMSAKTIPSKENLNNLLNIYASAQLPILVHCLGGADRTGEASALWLLYHEGASKDEALNQLSLKYLHFPILYPAKKFFIEIWQGQDWAQNVYNPDDYLN